MRAPARIAIGLLAVLVVGVLSYFVIQVFAPPTPAAAVIGLRYSQAQSVQNFDRSEHTVTDPQRLAAFTALVTKYGVDPGSFDESLNDVCTGGLETKITVNFATGPDSTVRIYDCATPVPKGTFVTDATALFTGWRAADR